MKENPIGVFDSGVGGLTVLREITRQLPGEKTIYLGDTARVPYGIKSRETVVRYSLEVAAFLSKLGIKLLVVACNTASAYALTELTKRLSIPVVGVIEPGAKAALRATRTNRIGIIGTQGTIRSNSYVDEINSLKRNETREVAERGEKHFDRYFEIRTDEMVIFTKACPLFVPLAEEGWTANDVARLTVEHYLKGLNEEKIDTLVLGCTHYPLLKETIASVMGKDVALIDSAESTAVEVKRVLKERGLLNDSPDKATHRFFVTDSPERFLMVGKRFFGEGLEAAELAELEAP
ncbi:MAG: glutamate racemase [Deltaproteobacteria bacterium]|nr:glutamate racemase [Deltaproteobacteria bacterium]